MIDYQDIGVRIREKRQEKGVSQEKLAEKAEVSTAHISHLETGHSIPSLKTLISILNALECSADEILCNELQVAKPQLNSWLGELVEDCTEVERKVITEVVITLKNSLRKH